jgi:hypothetical protein
MQRNWSMKALHRLMVTSSAYRMQSTPAAEHPNERIDPENRLLWRMNVRRMEAEAVRDSVLQASGSLDLTRGGPELNEETGQMPRRSLFPSHAKRATPVPESSMALIPPIAIGVREHCSPAGIGSGQQ